MVGMASFGTMTSMLSTGARIAWERQIGWTRQLRITPLTAPAYLRSKVIAAYAMAALSLVSLYVAGTILGVTLGAGDWLKMTGLIVLGLLPFAAGGIALGHLLNVDALGPALGGMVSLLALVSGSWFPVTHGFLHDVGQVLPSYWLVQAGRVPLHGHGWTTTGWIVVLGWTAALSVLAAFVYRRDTATRMTGGYAGGHADAITADSRDRHSMHPQLMLELGRARTADHLRESRTARTQRRRRHTQRPDPLHGQERPCPRSPSVPTQAGASALRTE